MDAMRGMKRVSALTLAALVLGGILTVTIPASAGGSSHVVPIDPASLDDPQALLKLYAPPTPNARRAVDPTADARCGDPAPDPIVEGDPLRVTIPPAEAFEVGKIDPATWRNPPVADPTWRLNFQGLMWMKPLARRAAMDGQQATLDALIAQAVVFHRQNPDPGNNNYGWDEGTALRRLETENCLYALSPSASLIAGMTADAGVLLGSRYYGPPNHPIHNHGLMANLQLVRAGDLTGKTSWKSTAIKRMTSEGPQAFSKYGFSYEQSSMYQLTNATLWEQAAIVLEASPGSTTAAATIRGLVSNAYRIFHFMTEPDGRIVQVGDSDEMAGQPANLGLNRAVRDDQAGWVIGRWGWTDPNAPYYTVRYGPARRAHGHHDRAGGVTWSTKGTRVLVGPGRYSYDTTSAYNRYQISPQGQNVAVPDKGTAGGGTSTITTTFNASSHVFVVKDTVYGRSHVRGVTVNRDLPRIVVSDSFPGTPLWRQSWHLDPDWTLASGGPGATKLVFTHPSGHKLTVGTTGRVSSVLRGVARGPYGWHFPRFQIAEAANEITIRNYGTACTTTFWVT
jgi:hypothetical protein